LRYLPLYIPFFLSLLFSGATELAYWTAWAGSWFILWLVFSGAIKRHPERKPWSHQVLRPLYLPHAIFAGYMALSSVFYFLHAKGYVYFTKVGDGREPEHLALLSYAQQMYVLAHAGLVHGIYLASRYRPPRYSFQFSSYSGGALRVVALSSVLVLLLKFVPGFKQFAVKFDNLSLVASVVALALVLPERKWGASLLALALFGFNLYQSTLSGFKEAVLVPVILLAALLYPQYKRLVTLAGPAAFVFLLFVLPFVTQTIREEAWQGEKQSDEAAAEALENLQAATAGEIVSGNWGFLTYRFSEISLFTKYLDNVPENRPFYGWQLIGQGFDNILPSALFPDKPLTEAVVMERVLENGIIEWYSVGKVSAKPQIVVDGYLSFGEFGAWAFCFVIGLLSAFASSLAERWFGGYLWGTGLMYTGFFQIFWRGNCTEFIMNTIFWSFVLMGLVFVALKAGGVVKKVRRERLAAPDSAAVLS
jgi:hypothetical protein